MKKKITVSDVTIETCHGLVKNILVNCGELKAMVEFLVVHEVPVGLLIGIPKTAKLNALVALSDQYVYFIIRRKSVRVGFKPIRTVHQK